MMTILRTMMKKVDGDCNCDANEEDDDFDDGRLWLGVVLSVVVTTLASRTMSKLIIVLLVLRKTVMRWELERLQQKCGNVMPSTLRVLPLSVRVPAPNRFFS